MPDKSQIKDFARKVLAEMATSSPAWAENSDTAAVRELIANTVADMSQYVPGADEAFRGAVAKIVEDESLGYGGQQPYLDDETITEIMVNGAENVFVEREGIISRVEERLFESDAEIERIIERIASETNNHCNVNTPDMDARLADGSRVAAVISPVALCGPSLTIRKFPSKRLTMADLVDKGSVSIDVMNLLACCVQARCNILVSGGTGSGKTTLLNVLSSCIPQNERVITIEDTAELKISVDNWVPMEARRANGDHSGEITIHRLLVDSLRMRPDRIIVGECRSEETVEMLQAMNTGHDGSLTTIHANDPLAAFNRIITLVKLSQNLDVATINRQIASALQLVVQTKRYSDGTRKISEVIALSGRTESEDKVIETVKIFEYDEAAGRHVATGNPLPESILSRIELSGAYFEPRWLFSDVMAGGY